MRQILVVRDFDEFSRVLTENGFSVINCPTITTVALEDLSDLAAKLKNNQVYDGFFLTSAAAAKILVEKLSAWQISLSRPIYVLGERSRDLLKNTNLNIVYFPSANTAREMLEKIAAEDFKGKRFLFIRGEKSLRVVPDFLSKVASVDETVVYKTHELKIETEKIRRLRGKFENKEVAAACFFSPSQAENFIKQFGAEILHQTRVAAIGKTTAEYFEQQNLSVNFVSSKATAKSFAVELINYLKEDTPAEDTKDAKKREKQ